MRLRKLSADECGALATFPLGALTDAWLTEVADILASLAIWLDEDDLAPGREVLAIEDDREIVAVTAHEAVLGNATVHQDHRYIMVTAVREDRRREGFAQMIIESVLEDLAARGARTATWLVHPENLPSIMFSRNTFPEADERYPPEDRPYAVFTLRLG